MRPYKADLHIHTVLSPCGDLDMTPAAVVRRAVECGVELIAVTDHNSTLHCAEVRRIGEREGVAVLCGAEITTAEEVHCLAYVEWGEPAERLQAYLSEHLPRVANDPALFGYQVVVDECERVIYQEERLLISALDQSLEEVEAFVHALGGIFIPAHLDKQANSLLSQLGFVPPDLRADAFELSPRADAKTFRASNPLPAGIPLVSFSDAHLPEELFRQYTVFEMGAPSLKEVAAALRGEGGRSVKIEK